MVTIPSEGIFTIVGTVAGGIILSLGAMLRRFSRDKVEYTKDRIENNVYDLLLKQRDEALEEVATLRHDLAVIAQENEEAVITVRELTARNEQMKAQVNMLTTLVKRLAAMNNVDVTAGGLIISNKKPQE